MTTIAPLVYDELVRNDREGFTIAEDDEYFYDALPYAFNWRLVMTPKADPRVWDYGWCYDGSASLILAMRVWNPETQNEPLGWKKRPTGRTARIAPRAGTEPKYNRPRCVHGHYPADGPCSTDPYCGIHDR
ncbi:hypothetical protein [Streptomyces sp. NPDC056670]|uniref:hypothetical protein n=1 Tax=Streptomyces sp. NPDC056670 TaxID=3345904 RepID=UPI00368EE4DA